jgi:ribosomal protein L7/L12
VEPQYNYIKVNRFYTIQVIFGDEAITPEEAKAGSIRTVASVEDEANYSVAKDTIEGTRLQAVENINKYQAEIINGMIEKFG